MSDQKYLAFEYHTCQQKISNAVEQLIRIELYIFLGISAIYTWFYATVNTETSPAESIQSVLYLPTLLAILAWYRASMQIKYIYSIARYLMLVEQRLSSSDAGEIKWQHVGWETWFEENGPKTWNRIYRFLLWPGLIVGTLMVATLGIGIR